LLHEESGLARSRRAITLPNRSSPLTDLIEGLRAMNKVINEQLRHQVAGQLAAGFKGDFIDSGHPDYPKRRVVWNAMVSKKPELILRCRSTADVVAAVNVARTNGLYPSIRCGGHQVAGKALADGGLTIDLSGMHAVSVDTDRMVAHVEGGCLLADVDVATARHGVVVPAGTVSETGVSGLALGGGVGWLSRPYGLTCDQFISLELVLATGEVIEVDARSHPDLFWALKGGGGNFGVVTRFTLRCHKFGPNMLIGAALYEPAEANEALSQYARMYPSLPRTVGWHAAFKASMPKLPFVPDALVGKRLVMLISMWLGDPADPAGLEMIKRLTSVGKPTVTATTVMPFAQRVQRIIDEEFPDGHRYYTKEVHLRTVGPEVIARLIGFWKQMPMDGEIELIGLGGAIGDVAEADSAFANRQYQHWLVFALRWDDPGKDQEYTDMTRTCLRDLAPWAGKGVYVNMLNDDDSDRIVEAYGGPEKYSRLCAVKGRYDPHNFFRLNANISPARTGNVSQSALSAP